jgi:hypothetical protein
MNTKHTQRGGGKLSDGKLATASDRGYAEVRGWVVAIYPLQSDRGYREPCGGRAWDLSVGGC